jgi:hypothetical protein
MYCNPLKGGTSPEYDDEFNSIYSYTPTFFDKKKKPSNAIIRTAFRTCFTDGDWLRLGKDVYVTRRTGEKYRLNFLVNTSSLPDLIEAEERIENLIEDLKFTIIKSSNLRYIVKKRIPKFLISSKDGIYVYSFPSERSDSLTLGYMESLKNFGDELAIRRFTEASFEQAGSSKRLNNSDYSVRPLELSNNIIQFNISIPIDNTLTFSIIQLNPNHVYDLLTRNMLVLATKFIREVLRRVDLLDNPFKNRIDIYKDAFEQPIFGGLTAQQILSDIQYGNEILIHPLMNIMFREITSTIKPIQMYVYNGYTGNLSAADYHHTEMNENGYPQIRSEYYENILEAQSKIVRAIAGNSIHQALLKGKSDETRIFILPVRYKTRFKGDYYRVSPPSLEFYLAFVGTLKNFSDYETHMKWIVDILRGIAPFCDTIYLRPEIDFKKRRTTRTIKINNMKIRLPDFSFLTIKKKRELERFVHENRAELLQDTILKMIEIVSYCRENLELKYT